MPFDRNWESKLPRAFGSTYPQHVVLIHPTYNYSHESALSHAQAAVFYCQEDISGGDANEDERGTDEEQNDRATTLAVAYHNLAVELEFLGRADLCEQVRLSVLTI